MLARSNSPRPDLAAAPSPRAARPARPVNPTRPAAAAVAIAIVAFTALASPLAAAAVAAAGPPSPPPSPAPDPSIAQDPTTGLFHVFCTGPGVTHLTSPDLVTWTRQPNPVLDVRSAGAPAASIAWIASLCPDLCTSTYCDDPDPSGCCVTNVWSPDISYFNGQWHLYYSVTNWPHPSQSGGQPPTSLACYPVSVIGLATSPTLDLDSPDYAWTDHGPILASVGMNNCENLPPGWSPADNCGVASPCTAPCIVRGYHAIGPQAFVDDDGRVYLSFGSFQHGAAQIEIDPTTGGPLAGAEVVPLATRHLLGAQAPLEQLVGNALEGPYIFKRGEFYYFFISYDYCCKGDESSYWLIVGRSESPQGPFRDRRGIRLAPDGSVEQSSGGGSVILASEGDMVSPGSMAMIEWEGCTYLVHHYYDASRNGAVTLGVRPVEWVEVPEGSNPNPGPWPQVLPPIGYSPPAGGSGGAACATGCIEPGSRCGSAACERLPASDPSLAKDSGKFFVFSTGPGIQYSTSTDLAAWSFCGRVFADDVPPWATRLFTTNGEAAPTIVWAPDLSFFNGQWHCYYTVSNLAGDLQAIGVATAPSLPALPVPGSGGAAMGPGCDAPAPTAQWTDHGAVLITSSSIKGYLALYRAIDPNVLVVPAAGKGSAEQVYLTFGSYMTGIHQIELDPTSGMPLEGATPTLLASRGFDADPTLNLNALEGAFVHARTVGGTTTYYLFTTFDNCCEQQWSTYYLVASAGPSPSGPFEDIAKWPMTEGGGTVLLANQGSMIGPGSIDLFDDPDTGCTYAVYSYSDATSLDAAGAGYTLGVRPVCWIELTQSNFQAVPWPRLGGMIGYEPAPPGACTPTGGPLGDLDGNGRVDAKDLALLLAAWGKCARCDACPEDLDGDCAVGGSDLALLLTGWG